MTINDVAVLAQQLCEELGLEWRPTVGQVEELEGVDPVARKELAHLLFRLAEMESGQPDPDGPSCPFCGRLDADKLTPCTCAKVTA